MTFDDIRKEVGHLRGFRRVSENWSAEQIEEIAAVIKKGLNKFYTGASYEWSFLAPLTTLTILDGTSELLLPTEFGFLMGDIYFDGSEGGCPLIVENEPKVLRRRQQDENATGRPLYAFTYSIRPGETHGQRQKLAYWPTADDDYTITLRYSVLPDALSPTNKYPWGGQAHSDTILEACLAASEQMDGELGIHTQLYMVALEASKDFDRNVKAQTISKEASMRRPVRWSNIVTENSGFYL